MGAAHPEGAGEEHSDTGKPCGCSSSDCPHHSWPHKPTTVPVVGWVSIAPCPSQVPQHAAPQGLHQSLNPQPQPPDTGSDEIILKMTHADGLQSCVLSHYTTPGFVQWNFG